MLVAIAAGAFAGLAAVVRAPDGAGSKSAAFSSKRRLPFRASIGSPDLRDDMLYGFGVRDRPGRGGGGRRNSSSSSKESSLSVEVSRTFVWSLALGEDATADATGSASSVILRSRPVEMPLCCVGPLLRCSGRGGSAAGGWGAGCVASCASALVLSGAGGGFPAIDSLAGCYTTDCSRVHLKPSSSSSDANSSISAPAEDCRS